MTKNGRSGKKSSRNKRTIKRINLAVSFDWGCVNGMSEREKERKFEYLELYVKRLTHE